MTKANSKPRIATSSASAMRLFAYLLFLTLFLAACNGLAGEPRIVSTIPPRNTATPFMIDTSVLDTVAGAAIFADRCADCHGANGEGGTQIVNGQTLENMPNFTDAATSADQTLEDYYTIITEGLIDQGKLMPGFASLTNQPGTPECCLLRLHTESNII